MFKTFENGTLPPDYTLAWAVKRQSLSSPVVHFVDSPTTAVLQHLDSDDVVCWVGKLLPTADLSTLAATAGLSVAERAELSAFRHCEDASAYAAAHGALRLMLATTFKCTPDVLQFAKDSYGKPYLRQPPSVDREAVHFSISHSCGLAAIALCHHPIGIDIERMRWSEDLLDVADSCFADEQILSLRAASGAQRTRLFFRYWTLCESLIKAAGIGFHQSIRGIAFTPVDPPKLVRLEALSSSTKQWHFGCRYANELA